MPVNSTTSADSCEPHSTVAPRQTIADGCPVLAKTQCHEVQMAQAAKLLWQFKTADGQPINLADCLFSCANSTSTSNSFDEIGTPGCGPVLRVRELSGVDPQQNQVFQLSVNVVNAAQGLVKAETLPPQITRKPGVYAEEWGVFDDSGNLLFTNQSCLFVRRGLFGVDPNPHARNLGPPSIEEIRLSLRDSRAENVLLDDFEFDAAEISQAVLRPIQYWNEIPPPIYPLQTTITFPFREMWLLGIQAYLMGVAASHYRRNQLAYNAGGISVDDKNKEAQYQAAGLQLQQQFREMVLAKKKEINIALFSGTVGSAYSGMFYS